MTMEPTPPGKPEPDATAESAAQPMAGPVAAVAAAVAPAAPAPPTWQAPAETTGPFPGVRFADHGARLISFVLDHLIILGISILFAVVFGLLAGVFAVAGAGLLTASFAIVAVIGFVGTYFVYFPYFWTKDGQTLGMRPFHLRVVMDKDGGPVTLGPAILRLFGYWIDQIVFYLGYIWVLIDARRRGWHDLIAGTVVVQEE
jgi:uncharacterized RDD family membrane protein YckC